MCDKYGVKASLLLWLNQPAHYYEGAVHPVLDDMGKNVMMNLYMFKMIKPLLLAQPYIKSVKAWQGEEVHINLDRIRELNGAIGMPYGDIRRWIMYAYPDLAADTSQPCLSVPDVEPDSQIGEYGDYILVNRSERYLNNRVSYMFLKKYPKVIFAGTPGEYAIFQQMVPTAFHLAPENFLELAQWIKYAKLFVGNQSFCYSIAEQMKTPRVLEVCNYAPNVIPVGKDGYDFYNQDGLEYYVEKLWKGETP